MAKKHKAQLPKDRSQLAVPQGAVGQLQEAFRRLRRGDVDVAIRLGAAALSSAQAGRDAVAAGSARNLLAEAHFRAFAIKTEPKARLGHLDEALKYAPGLAKLRFHRGVVLWQLGRLQEAIPELDAAFAAEPGRPWLGYLRQLARLAAGQPWDARGLPDVEANTLRVVGDLVQPQGRKPAHAALPEPLLGKGTELWQGLLELRRDPSAALVDLLCHAAEKNARKPVQGVLLYYQGLAAFRSGDRDAARNLWVKARGAGMRAPWLDQNLAAFLQEQLVGPAQEGRWQDVLDEARRAAPPAGEVALSEVLGLAHYHLGYDAAQAGQWSTAVRHFREADVLSPSRYVAQNLALAEEALGHWELAANAWRDMVKRRPRKEGHPDYLTDAQVAVIWDHVAECYARADVPWQAITTLKNAAKYAPENVDQRLKLVEVLMAEERDDAAINELERILELEPEHEGALMRLAALYKRSYAWGRDPMPIWRRVLAANPGNAEAREELVQAYLEQAGEDTGGPPRFLLFGPPTSKRKIDVLRDALKEVPGHPKLLSAMGSALLDEGKNKEAQPYLLQAFQAAPQSPEIVGGVIHDLLHLHAYQEVESMLPAARQIPALLPDFWIDQGEMALDCDLGDDWARRFFDEALQLVGRPWVQDSRAAVLVKIVEAAGSQDAEEFASAYRNRIHAEAPTSGGLEYLEAQRLFIEKRDQKGARKLLRKARQAAQASKDEGMLKLVEVAEAILSLPPDLTSGLIDLLENMG